MGLGVLTPKLVAASCFFGGGGQARFLRVIDCLVRHSVLICLLFDHPFLAVNSHCLARSDH